MEDNLKDFGTGINEAETTLRPKVIEDIADGESCGNNYNYIQWTNLGDGIYTHTGHTLKTLDPAAYSIFANRQGIFLRKERISSDNLIEFKDSIADNILSEIETFWNSKEIYKKYGFLHRRGYLFYGEAGCGKSGIVYLIISKIIKRNGIVLICANPELLSGMVKIVRAIEPERHIVIVFEDIDAIIRNYGESEVLSFLDGEAQANDILNLATTNYPERLDKRIVARPRRFDKRILITPPSASTRKEFFTKKLKIEKDIDKWVELTDKFTFAAMTELVIRVECLGIPLEEAVKDIKTLIFEPTPSSDALSPSKLGFEEVQ